MELDQSLEDMIESLLEKKLENCIETLSVLNDREENEGMGYKYKERVKVGVDDSGAPVYSWVYANTKDDLHAQIADAIAKGAVSAAEAPTSGSNTLWYDRAIHWYDTFHVPRVGPCALAKDKQLLEKHILPAFGDKRIADITTADIQNFLETKKDYSKSVVRDVMAMMRGIFADAYEDDIIPKNPMASKRITNPAKKETVRRALTPEEQADILANLWKLKEPNARRLMGLLMFTPMRPCEIYGLRWEDLDLERMELHVCRSKTFACSKVVVGPPKTKESDRYLPIDDNILSYLEPLGTEGYILEGITSEIVIRRLWGRIKKTIDLHGMTPYMGRHTFATNMSRAGVPMKTAMALMGHADERMLLRRYTHVDEKDLHKAANVMSDFMSNFGKEGAQ